MVHQQSKIFYRSEAGKNQCSITDILLVFLLHSCRISYSAGEPFVPEGIIRLYPRGQMVHHQSKIFYRSGAGKLKRYQ
jgi:hypothetical protein